MGWYLKASIFSQLVDLSNKSLVDSIWDERFSISALSMVFNIFSVLCGSSLVMHLFLSS